MNHTIVCLALCIVFAISFHPCLFLDPVLHSGYGKFIQKVSCPFKTAVYGNLTFPGFNQACNQNILNQFEMILP